VDAEQLVYPLIAFSHVGDALEMRPASCVAGELVLLGMRKLVRPDKEEATWVAAVLQNLLKYKVKKPCQCGRGYEGQITGATWRSVSASRLFC
jgi:hypothetical protein